MGLVSGFLIKREAAAYHIRELGDPDKSEWTVVKVDAYNGINEYLSRLENTHIKTVKDVVAYNEENKGTEGPEAGDNPAFPSGQVSGQPTLLMYSYENRMV